MNTNTTKVIHHPDGTIEWSDGHSSIRIPASSVITKDQLRDALNDEDFLIEVFGAEKIKKAKDADLAHKIIDTKKVSGLLNTERARLFEILTGIPWLGGKDRNEKSEAVRDLKLALELEYVTGSKRHRLIRERTGKYGAQCKTKSDKTGKAASTTNINKYDAKLKAMLKQVEAYDRTDLEFILDCAIEGGYKLTLDGIITNLEATLRLLGAFPEAFKEFMSKKENSPNTER